MVDKTQNEGKMRAFRSPDPSEEQRPALPSWIEVGCLFLTLWEECRICTEDQCDTCFMDTQDLCFFVQN